tara:strand:- start:731 stop:1045 length:315 start_codon:yes stop_codon:yes gene_type:complete
MNRRQESFILGAFAAAAVYLIMNGCGKSSENYAPLKTSAPKTGDDVVKGLRSLKYSIECVPGSETGGYYSKSLTPGGVCGDQQYVNDAMHSYSIEAGVGGNLLD